MRKARSSSISAGTREMLHQSAGISWSGCNSKTFQRILWRLLRKSCQELGNDLSRVLKNRLPLLVAKVRGRGDRQHRTHRLDSVRFVFRVDQRHHHVGRLASAAGANNADACHSISVARLSARFSRASALRPSRSSAVRSGRRPASCAAWLTQSRNVSAVQPIFSAAARASPDSFVCRWFFQLPIPLESGCFDAGTDWSARTRGGSVLNELIFLFGKGAEAGVSVLLVHRLELGPQVGAIHQLRVVCVRRSKL